ncbi:protein kinase [Streptomyces sp. NPDC047009]|uniref:serine/threonine-protein kinase n=1 Tax=Streptomyces sp. NPDC047009 TaxID=3154496 RepID=UPI00340EF572
MSADVVGGRYRLDAKIGTGGVADVYEGMDLRLMRPVAVKVFRSGADQEMEERCADEAVLLARMQHPGLVTVYDAGRHKDLGYLVMELVKGPTLSRRISSGLLTPGHVAELGAALAGALAHVHAAGIVHRDVKPSNVLLDDAGNPHLADFGISRMMNATRHTASGALIGTAAYLAPEQVLGKGIGPAADIYALGLVLLECLKGELEYDGTPLEAAIARLHRRPDIPCSVPPDLAHLLSAMTALDPEARPTAGECAEALSALSHGPVPVPSAEHLSDAATTQAAGIRSGEGAGGPAARQAARGGRRVRAVRIIQGSSPEPVTHRRPGRVRGGSRRLAQVTGTAVLTAVLGATLSASADRGDYGADRAASGAPGSTQHPSTTLAENTPKRGVPPAQAPSGSPAETHGPATVTDPSRDARHSPSSLDGSTVTRTWALHESDWQEEARHGAQQTQDPATRRAERPTQPKDGPGHKHHPGKEEAS